MARFFSLVIPTRHRPAFVKEALFHISRQSFTDFEVIVSDNYVDPALSCEAICRESGLLNLRYVRPPRPLGMVENWSFALAMVSGEYVMYFTDKMVLLPDALGALHQAVEATHADLYSWTDDSFTPIDYAQPFGPGSYVESKAMKLAQKSAIEFDPSEELSFKASGRVRRDRMTPSQYCRGKICFGAYSHRLIERIDRRFGAMFRPIAPDYTSMIFALTEAQSAYELPASGVVHLNTLISNGMLCATDDKAAKAFLSEIGVLESMMSRGLVPGLYTSVSANVAFDYLALRDDFQIRMDMDLVNWLAQVWGDVYTVPRTWSEKRIEQDQKARLQSVIDTLSMGDKEHLALLTHALSGAGSAYDRPSLSQKARQAIKNALVRANAFGTLEILHRLRLLKGKVVRSLRHGTNALGQASQ